MAFFFITEFHGVGRGFGSVHRMERAIHKQRLESERLRNDMQVARNSAARTRTATVEERHLLDQLQSRRQVLRPLSAIFFLFYFDFDFSARVKSH